MMTKVLIIAEAGVNHNGDLSTAIKLIDVAAEAGVDMVKFQTFSADRLVTRDAKKADYQNQATSDVESQYGMLKRLEMTSDMHVALMAHCQKKGVVFLSTGFDVQSVNYLIKLGIDCLKIPSGEITNLPYLRHIGSLEKNVILSTGMSTLGEIEDALEVLEESGTRRECITVLHCNTEYPTPMRDVNLRAMNNISTAFGVAVGYSDHTLGIEVPIAAVALGARVIEKHFTLSRALSGPDHQASLEPDELKAMVVAIRNIELAMGDGVKRPSLSELKNKPVARKSLVAAKIINKGELFTSENITIKRPGTGISPMRLDDIIGRRALRDYAIDELVSL
jgi:N,N'-diacetyllegionaminate synthase